MLAGRLSCSLLAVCAVSFLLSSSLVVKADVSGLHAAGTTTSGAVSVRQARRETIELSLGYYDSFCWKDRSLRAPVSVWTACAAQQRGLGGVCYQPCPAGMSGNGAVRRGNSHSR